MAETALDKLERLSKEATLAWYWEKESGHVWLLDGTGTAIMYCAPDNAPLPKYRKIIAAAVNLLPALLALARAATEMGLVLAIPMDGKDLEEHCKRFGLAKGALSRAVAELEAADGDE